MKVFLCESIHPKALAYLKTRAEIVSSWDELETVDVIINRNLKLPFEVLSKAKHLKVIAVHGTGSDGIDLQYCENHNITIIYVPFQNSNSVAELIVTFALTMLRKLPLADRLVISGKLTQNAPPELFGNELHGKTFGLIGVGDIARRVARMVKTSFDCRVIGYDPYYQEEKATKVGVERCMTIEELLGQADIVNISVHYSESTANLINAERLALCKPNMLLINTSRGGIVDEGALYDALKSRKIGGAACDVWLHEPPSTDNPLVGLDNVLATPHLGANTDEALLRVGMQMVEEIFSVMDGRGAKLTYSLSGVKTN